MPAPDSTLVMLDGTQNTLESFKGKSVLLTFWAQWCSHARPVLMQLEELAKQYQNRDDLVFIALSVDKEENLEKLKDAIRFGKYEHIQQEFSGNDFYDETYNKFEITSLPAVYIIDPSGTIVSQGSNESIVIDYLKKKS